MKDEIIEFEGKMYRRTGKWEYPKPGDVYWWESHRVPMRLEADVRAVMLSEILEEVGEVPAPEPAAPDAVRELAAKLCEASFGMRSQGAESEISDMISKALAPLLAKTRKQIEEAKYCHQEFNPATQQTRWQPGYETFGHYTESSESELARWGPKP